MRHGTYIVVGDIFKGPLSNLDRVLTETDAIDLIVKSGPIENDVSLKVQQGVNVLMLNRAIEFHRTAVPASGGRFVLQFDEEMPRAVQRLAHKARPENICVSFPRRMNDREYELDLQFSAQNEFFLDHMTGMHIQGMALNEAARQAFLVVTEEFFLNDSNDKWYFVIHRQNASFEQFVFPFSARLSYKIVNHSVKSGRHTFEVLMTITQANTRCCSFDVSFTTFEALRISKREEELAEQRIAAMLDAPVVNLSGEISIPAVSRGKHGAIQPGLLV